MSLVELADEKRDIHFDYVCPYRTSSNNLKYISLYEQKSEEEMLWHLYYCKHGWLCTPCLVRRSCKPILLLDAHRKYI